jgi:hypothetical protein
MSSPLLVDWLERSGCRPILVGSHPRSGTHLLIDSLRYNFPECRSWKFWGERSDRLYVNLASLVWKQHPLSQQTAIRILQRVPRPIVKTHAFADLNRDIADFHRMTPHDPALLQWLRRHAVFLYSYRDGRAMLVSWHEMLSGSNLDARVSFSEFIRQQAFGVSRVRNWANHVRSWMDEPSAFCVSMEELIAEPQASLAGYGQKLGLKLDTSRGQLPRKTASRWEHRFKRLFTIRPQSTALIGRHPHRNWREAFSPDDRKFFEQESEGLLIKLGYEKNNNWING